MDEFSIIAKYFKPLAAGFAGSLNLCDDAALLTVAEGHELVVTKDAISSGVHFTGSESPDLIASKALRVNLSDLAAMGARPVCYFLALMLPKDTSEEWLRNFAEGLRKTQDEFKISLAGGDTTATDGGLSISITAIGSVPKGKVLKRSGAKAGDDIYVSGTLGDSALGLLSLLCYLRESGDLGQFGKSPEIPAQGGDDEYLINRYLTPQPRVELGITLRGIATGCMDISDGLVQDLGHVCAASGVGAEIYTDKIIFSPEFITCHPALVAGSGTKSTAVNYNSRPCNQCGVALEMALTGGDDYELLFTASPDKKAEIEQLAKDLKLPLTCIGKVNVGSDVVVFDEKGKVIELEKKGFSHF